MTKKLKKGDLVFIDIGCGVEGYNTDKTTTYMFGSSLPQYAIDAHNKCVEIQNEAASMLKTGAIPSKIYNNIMNNLDSEFLQNFMGFGKRKVRFLGHGVGLLIDELPVTAEGFDEPLQEGMVFLSNLKKGIENIGMVGIENTFIVADKGGENKTVRSYILSHFSNSGSTDGFTKYFVNLPSTSEEIILSSLNFFICQ